MIKVLGFIICVLFLVISAHSKDFPDPPSPQWTFYDQQRNVSCVLVRMNMNLKFNYTTVENKTTLATFSLPDENTVHSIDGVCAPLFQYITLGWGQANESTVRLEFAQDQNSSTYTLSNIQILLNVSDTFADAAGDQMLQAKFNTDSSFVTEVNAAYACLLTQKLWSSSLKATQERPVSMEISNVLLEAFHEGPVIFSSFVDRCLVDQYLIKTILIAVFIGGLLVIMLGTGIVCFIRYLRSRSYDRMQ